MSDFDPLDTEQPDDRKAKAELRDAQIESALKWLMADPRGRRLVRLVLEWGGFWRTSFTGEALGTVFREGERNVASRLLALVTEHCPERLVDLMKNEGDT